MNYLRRLLNIWSKWIRLIIPFLCFWFLTAQAEEPESYAIEIIVYSQINEAALRSEYWPALPPQIIPAEAIGIPGDQLLPQSQWQLKPSEQILKREHHTILLHQAWVESAAELRREKILHLTGGEIYGENLHQLNGTLSVKLERYFTVHFNLRFLLPLEQILALDLTNIDHKPEDPYAAFKIDKELRMRSNELNYIDHPLYGILMEITPYTIKSPSSATTSAT